VLRSEDVSSLFSPDRELPRDLWTESCAYKYKVLFVSKDSVERLKEMHCRNDNLSSAVTPSTQDLVAAKLWSDIAVSNRFSKSGLFKIESFRRNPATGITEDYFGNAIVFVRVNYDFNSESPSHIEIARKIRSHSNREISEENIRAASQYNPCAFKGEPIEAGRECLVLNNLSKLPLSKFDFPLVSQ